MKEQKNCIIDCRVSDPKQLQGGSLDDQEIICRGVASRNGWKVLKVFKKPHTASKLEREDINKIVNYIKKSKTPVHYYLFKSIDRLTRLGGAGYFDMKIHLAGFGVQVVDAYGVIQPTQDKLSHLGDFGYDWSNYAPSEIAETLEAERGKQERRDILLRMIGAEIALTQEGYKVRQPSDGFINKHIFVGGKKKVIEVADPKRAHYFIKIYELRAEGLDDKEIVRRVNAMGFLTKRLLKRFDI